MIKILFQNYTFLSAKEQLELLSIRNQEKIRELSLSNKFIQEQDHLQWIRTLKEDKNKEFYAISVEGKIVGGINIFSLNFHPTWGIFFNDKTELLTKALVPLYFLEYIFDKFNIKTIHSEILSNNENALSFNKSLGFKEISVINDIVKLELSYDNFSKKKKSILLKPLLKKMKLFDFTIKA